jgi:hypothetical protein
MVSLLGDAWRWRGGFANAIGRSSGAGAGRAQRAIEIVGQRRCEIVLGRWCKEICPAGLSSGGPVGNRMVEQSDRALADRGHVVRRAQRIAERGRHQHRGRRELGRAAADGLAHRRGTWEALFHVAFQGAHDRGFEFGRDLRREAARRRIVAFQEIGEDLHIALAEVRRAPAQHLVEHHPGRIDVSAVIDRCDLTNGLLGRHVEWRSQNRSDHGPGHLGSRARAYALRRGEHLGDAEVHDLHEIRPFLAAQDEDVVWLQVAVDDAVLVRGREAAQHLVHQMDGQRKGKPRCLAQDGRQRFPVQKLHRHEQQAVTCPAEVEHVDDVGMADGARGARLALEAGAYLRVGADLFKQGLDRDPSLKRDVQGLVHHAHDAAADLPRDLILAAQYLSHRQGGGAPGCGRARHRLSGDGTDTALVGAAAMWTRHGARITAARAAVSEAAGPARRSMPNTHGGENPTPALFPERRRL